VTAAYAARLRTAADLSHEPDDGLRRELHDGVVYVVPPPSNRHSRATLAAYRCLFAGAPDGVEVLHDVGIHVGLRRLYVPDLLAVRADTPFHDNGYDPGGVLLAVEVVSPSSVTLDRITKPVIYADQRIPYFWRIDTVDEGKPVLQAYALDGRTRTYVQEAELGPGDAAALEHPWTVAVDMAQFVLPGPG
jgi:Uma2 family endonuclease